MTDTPETDLEDDLYVECASSYIIKESTGAIFTGDFVPAEFARRLERERDEARDILDKMILSLDAERAMRHIQLLQSERDQLKALNAELLESLEEVINDWQYGYGASKYECTSYDIARELLTKVKEAKS